MIAIPSVLADPIQTHLQEDPDRQHGQSMVPTKLHIRIEHPWPQGGRLVGRLDLDVHQG
jgi:hypothetical protein